MNRAGKLIARMRLGLSPQELARAAWPQAVGKRIALHAQPVSLRDGKLTVEVDDGVWQAQLTRLERQIVGRLGEIIGEGIVARIEFRERLPRRLPQRAEQRACGADEADGIAEPVFQRLYKESRRRSPA